jgi:hypothetical protein
VISTVLIRRYIRELDVEPEDAYLVMAILEKTRMEYFRLICEAHTNLLLFTFKHIYFAQSSKLIFDTSTLSYKNTILNIGTYVEGNHRRKH